MKNTIVPLAFMILVGCQAPPPAKMTEAAPEKGFEIVGYSEPEQIVVRRSRVGEPLEMFSPPTEFTINYKNFKITAKCGYSSTNGEWCGQLKRLVGTVVPESQMQYRPNSTLAFWSDADGHMWETLSIARVEEIK